MLNWKTEILRKWLKPAEYGFEVMLGHSVSKCAELSAVLCPNRLGIQLEFLKKFCSCEI